MLQPTTYVRMLSLRLLVASVYMPHPSGLLTTAVRVPVPRYPRPVLAAEAERLVKGVNVLVVTPGRLLDHLQVRRCFPLVMLLLWQCSAAVVAPSSAVVGFVMQLFRCSIYRVPACVASPLFWCSRSSLGCNKRSES